MKKLEENTWEEKFWDSSSEIETYVFTKVEVRATFTLSLGFRVCARELLPPGWVTTIFGIPGLASLELDLASARLAAMTMVLSGIAELVAPNSRIGLIIS